MSTDMFLDLLKHVNQKFIVVVFLSSNVLQSREQRLQSLSIIY